LGFPASKVSDSLEGSEAGRETVLIQGIIDVWFEEEGQIVLLDYKTDAVRQGEEQRLIDRYQLQLEYYRQALEQLEHKAVKETVIYSFGLGKSIEIPRGRGSGK
ncbi:MAG: PD-(D/E)XK nuclease family protein, partial [Lachnospiraceae bacterium]|nr:PD-(D/E)XK nuclease family protein [Lachnospiraceae bacterium]